MGGSPFYPTSLFDPFLLRHVSPPSPPRRPRSVISIPVTQPQPSPTPLQPSSAAAKIQSRFRGFAVRSRNPLIHLRTIASVQRQVDRLHSDLQRPEFASSIRAKETERLRVSESIMALLLRLDAIEGAIPEIRSRRKDVIRKAIQLQEAIDSLMQETEQDAELDSKVEDDFETDCMSLEAHTQSGIVEEEGENRPSVSPNLVNPKKAFYSEPQLPENVSRICNALSDIEMQIKSEDCQIVKVEPSTSDGSYAEVVRQSLQRLTSPVPADPVDMQGINEMKRPIVEDGTESANDPEKRSSLLTREDVVHTDVSEQISNLGSAGEDSETCNNSFQREISIESTNLCRQQTEAVAVENTHSKMETPDNAITTETSQSEMLRSRHAIADISPASPADVQSHQLAVTPNESTGQMLDKPEIRDAESACQVDEHESKKSKTGGSEDQALSEENLRETEMERSEVTDTKLQNSFP